MSQLDTETLIKATREDIAKALAASTEEKLTRSEVADIIIGSIDQALLEWLNEVTAKKEELLKDLRLDLNTARSLMTRALGSVGIEVSGTGWGPEPAATCSIHIRFEIQTDLLPAKYLKARAARIQLDEEGRSINRQRERLRKSKGDLKRQLLLSIVSASANGRKLRDALQVLETAALEALREK